MLCGAHNHISFDCRSSTFANNSYIAVSSDDSFDVSAFCAVRLESGFNEMICKAAHGARI